MCGIAGIVHQGDDYREIMARMLNAIKYRGPDDYRIKQLNKCCLGHVRLSIVDIHSGHQPMKSTASCKYIIFNGEIYGYKNLLSEQKEYNFQTKSDTEVILSFYEKYGTDSAKILPGMFAFAIWDDTEEILYAARDRFGEKPFYYAVGVKGELIFASEIKAILATNLVIPRLSVNALSYYLKYLYINPYETIYENIFILPPAHSLIYKNGKINIQRYWNIPLSNNSISLSEARDEFRRLFELSVKNQLVADVSVGAFLSGGLDSSTVVAVASQFVDRITTISFGFEDAVSELPYAQQISQRYGTKHIELTAEQVDIAELLLTMNSIYDEPFADSSNIPTYLISKLASKEFKVILTGDGADELLGGYWWWYYPLIDISKKNQFNKIFDKFILFIMQLSHRLRINIYNEKITKTYLKSLNHSKYNDVITAYCNKIQYFNNEELLLLLNHTSDSTYAPYRSFIKTNTVNDAMNMDIQDYLPGDILVKIDRASMSNSLELRAPFLDIDFASFCLSLSDSLKINKYSDKIILRNAYEDLWSPDIRKRGKQGFGAPVEKWLVRKSVMDLRNDYLNNKNKKIFSIISYKHSRKIVKENSYRTWILLVLSIWIEDKYLLLI